MKWNIVMDSCCDLTRNNFYCKNAEFEMAPLKLIVGEKEFVDDDNINVDALLAAMNAEKKASSSACPSPDDFAQSFMKSENTFCFTMTSGLSGTFNCAKVAKTMVQETNPEKNIHVIDTHAAAGVLVLMGKKADELIGQGLTFEEICPLLDEYCETLQVVFSLSQFDNLIKTGRMKPIVGAIATHLGIRAVAVNSPQGTIEVVKKPRGEDKAIAAMVDIMLARKPMKDKPVVISHCKNKEGAELAKKMIQEKCQTNDVTINECKGLTTFYAMEKGILIGY